MISENPLPHLPDEIVLIPHFRFRRPEDPGFAGADFNDAGSEGVSSDGSDFNDACFEGAGSDGSDLELPYAVRSSRAYSPAGAFGFRRKGLSAVFGTEMGSGASA